MARNWAPIRVAAGGQSVGKVGGEHGLSFGGMGTATHWQRVTRTPSFPPMPGGTISVLVVDDHPAVRAGLRALIDTEQDMRAVGEASDEFTLLPAVHRFEPDVVLLDYQLPGTNGIALCRRLKSGRNAPRIVIYSSFVAASMAVPARLAGADALVDKAVPPRELTGTIRRVASGAAEVPEVTPEAMSLAGELLRGRRPAYPRDARRTASRRGTSQRRSTSPWRNWITVRDESSKSSPSTIGVDLQLPASRARGYWRNGAAMPRQTLLWRVFSANAIVLVTAVALLALLPITVSWPVSLGEVLVLAGGLLVMLVANLVLLRRILTPLRRLRSAMSTMDPQRLGEPVDVGARSVEVAQLTSAFNDMLDRLDHERRESSRRTQAAQEQERRSLSLELHDEVGQNLTALLLQLDVVSRSAANPGQEAALATSIGTVRDCLEQVRTIVRRLRPEALDDLGLVSALEHLCDRVGNDTGMIVDHSLDPEVPRLTPDAQLVVYRVTQESLTNAVRHSGARRVLVKLQPADGGLRLTVTDDGVGVPEGRAEGSGIRGMRERALMVGAALRVAPRSPSGTSVTLEIPATEACA